MGCESNLGGALHFPPSLPFPLLPLCPPIPHPNRPLRLDIGPLNPARGAVVRCKLPVGNLASGGNNFNDFPENQMTKCHAEFLNFMQHLKTRVQHI